MDHKHDWNQVVTRLRSKSSISVTQFEIGSGATPGDLEVLRLLETMPPPPAVLRFYETTNGVKLLWSGNLGGEAVQGSVNIVSVTKSALRAPAQEEGEPLEDVLWNEEFPGRVLKDLKRMAVFEAIAGQSAYLTYFVDTADSKLFLVREDQIRPIIPDFDTTVELLELYAGADGLREHLTHKDWRERIAKDKILQWIAVP